MKNDFKCINGHCQENIISVEEDIVGKSGGSGVSNKIRKRDGRIQFSGYDYGRK